MNCHNCGSYPTEVHHVFFGFGNRDLSNKYKMIVNLCPKCHRSHLGVHGGNKDLDLKLKREYQLRFIEKYPDVNFISVFGRNYL